MNILAVIGSPRKQGNTDLVIDQILAGARRNTHRSEKIYLYDYEISPCIDCRNCKKGDYVCTIEDDMQELYLKIEKADFMIFGTPLYWYGPSAKMKLFIDRLRPYVVSGNLNKKKASIVVPSQEGPKSCEPVMDMFHLILDHLGIEFAGQFLPVAYEKGEIRTKKAFKNALMFGQSL